MLPSIIIVLRKKCKEQGIEAKLQDCILNKTSLSARTSGLSTIQTFVYLILSGHLLVKTVIIGYILTAVITHNSIIKL